jgi:hypothetical protein
MIPIMRSLTSPPWRCESNKMASADPGRFRFVIDPRWNFMGKGGVVLPMRVGRLLCKYVIVGNHAYPVE